MPKHCVVVCSGGLDSTTAAAHARYVDAFDKITLLHFKYRCHAEAREVQAVNNIADVLNARAVIYEIDWLKQIGGSRLTDDHDSISGPIEGAEYPHEWVPARNLLFLSYAAAFCDANDVSAIYMGLNLEESAVYSDNTVEFYERMDKVLQLATISRPRIVMPLARMMKWEIVKYAHEINAPIHLSWSCYRSGEFHCGNCGPCYMRKTAHRMIGISDSVQYSV